MLIIRRNSFCHLFYIFYIKYKTRPQFELVSNFFFVAKLDIESRRYVKPIVYPCSAKMLLLSFTDQPVVELSDFSQLALQYGTFLCIGSVAIQI